MLQALKALLSDGVDKDQKDSEGRTALHFSCGYGEVMWLQIFVFGFRIIN